MANELKLRALRVLSWGYKFMLYSFITSVVCFGGASLLIFWQVYNIRRGRVTVSDLPQISWRRLVIKTFDTLVLYGALLLRAGSRLAYINFLVGAKKVTSWSKHQLGRLERWVGGVIYSTRSSNKTDLERGATSLFLREIKNHQEQVKRDLRALSPNHQR